MATRAYRVTEIKYADPSFTFGDEPDLISFLESQEDVFVHLHEDGGEINVPPVVLRKALRKSSELNLSATTIAHLKNDIQFAKLNHNETVTYSCF